MAFPSTLDDFTPKTDTVNDVMAADVNELQTAIEALEAKIGVDASAVGTSLDYLIKAASNPGHTHTAYEAADATILKSAAIGVSIQAYDADLAAIAGLSPSDGDIIQRVTGAWTNRTMAQLKTSLSLAKGDVGLGNVDNTSDANKAVLSATKWATARNLAGNSVDGSGNVAFSNKFIVQGTADAGLSGAQFLGALATGLLKNTTTTGVLSIATASDIPDLSGTYVTKALYDAYSILYADTDNTPAALTVGASTIVGRKSTGGIVALTAAELRTIINVADGAEVNVNADWNSSSGDSQILNKPTLGTMAGETATNYVAKSLFDAYSILYADTDNTPAALTVGASTIVGRKASGGIVALTAAEALAIVGAFANPMNAAGDIIYGGVSGAATRLGKGSDGQVLTLASGNPSWATPAAATVIPKSIVSTAFETKARFSENLSGATTAYDASGVTISTANTNTNYGLVSLFLDPGYLLGTGCVFTAAFRVTTVPTSNNPTAYVGIGSPSISSGSLVYTTRHIGFKLVKESGSYNLYATNGDGSTETATLMASGLTSASYLEVIAERVGASSINYYYRLNGGALSAATNHTTNIPTTTSGDYAITVGAGNHGVTSAPTIMSVYGMSYQR